MRQILVALVAWVMVMASSACVLEDVGFEGKSCPCDDGWHCVDDVCQRGVPSLDAGADAGALDAGALDAGPPDAGADAGPPDAGTDAGPADAGLDAAPPDPTRCDDLHSGAIFCDGFEELALDSWTGTYATDGYTGRDTTQTFAGLGSLFASSEAPGGRAAARSSVLGGVTSGDVFLRAWVYVPSDFTIENFSMVQAGQNAAPYHHVSVGLSTGAATGIYVSSDSGYETAAGEAMALDEWVCLEAHVLLDDTAGVAEYWMNGTLQARIEGFDTVPIGGYQRHLVGLPYTSTEQLEARIYVDEVVVDDSRIGCE